jgi:S1/P1 Nuclease
MPRSRSHVAVISFFVSVLLMPQTGHAWGRQGHRIVARVAAKNLSPDARKKVSAILGVTDAGLDTAMANASIWPDLIDKKKTGTREWHFIDVPISSPFSVSGLCTNHECVLDRIDEMQNRLRNNEKGFQLLTPPDPPRTMTSQEMAFLIHFIGDVHQPLHAAVNGDRGGNCVVLKTAIVHADPNIPTTTELHAAWDTDEVLAVMKTHANSEAKTATALFQKFKSGSTVTQAAPTDWAHESNDLAKSAIYQKLAIAPHTAPPGQCATGIAKVAVDQTYLDGNVADVEQRLMQAGIRLSNVLKDICQADGCKAKP